MIAILARAPAKPSSWVRISTSCRKRSASGSKSSAKNNRDGHHCTGASNERFGYGSPRKVKCHHSFSYGLKPPRRIAAARIARLRRASAPTVASEGDDFGLKKSKGV